MTKFPRIDKHLIHSITILGLMIAVVVGYQQHGHVNDDFVLYHEVARLIALGDFQSALSLYNWPLYPAIIALLSKTGITLHASAIILNTLFFVITTYCFLSIIEVCGGGNLQLISGALLLFSTQYIVGDVLPMLIKDQGFWAFYLAGLLSLMQYLINGKLRDAILWQVCMLIAMLFRIEAISFLLLMPLITFKAHPDQSWASYFKTISITVCCALAIALLIIAYPSLSLEDTGRLREAINIFQRSYIQIVDEFGRRSELMGHYVLGKFLDDYSPLAIFLSFTGILIVKSISSAGWIPAYLAWKTRENPLILINDKAKFVLRGALLISVLNGTAVLINTFVLSGRYLISLAFIILIYASFQLAFFVKTMKYGPWRYRCILAIVIILVGGVCANLLPKSAGYNYEIEAVKWLKLENTQQKPVFYVSPRARYYAEESFQGRGYNYWAYTENAIQNQEFQKYDYLLINLNYRDRDHLDYLKENLGPFSLIKQFWGEKKKNVILIFKRD